jgi:2-dehydropantoate 2-reductase
MAGTRLAAVDARRHHCGGYSRRKHIVIGCVVHASCSVNGPGFVQQHFGNKLIIGEPSGEKTARVETARCAGQQAGFEATYCPNRSRKTPGTSCGAT